MQRPTPGKYVTVATTGEPFEAFVPAPLPPDPPLIVPNDGVLGAFSRLTGTLRAQIASNDRESDTLASLRDVLLKLTSGDLREKDAARLSVAAA
jgi:hypothetical protein